MDQAEKLRNVIKLQNQHYKPDARVITVTSGKGGVGKSNLVVNLAIWLQKAGKTVIIFDADFGLANVEVMFGAIPKYNLSDMVYRGMSLADILTEGPEGIRFISAGTGILELNHLSPEQLSRLVKSLRELDRLADVVLVDTGAGISSNVLEFLLASPEILVVATPDPSSLTDSYSLLKALYRHPDFKPDRIAISMVANFVSSEEDAIAVYQKLNSVVGQFLQGEIRYLGMIPSDPALEKAIRKQKPISLMNPGAPSSQAFEKLASELVSREHTENLMQAQKSFSQLFTDFLKK